MAFFESYQLATLGKRKGRFFGMLKFVRTSPSSSSSAAAMKTPASPNADSVASGSKAPGYPGVHRPRVAPAVRVASVGSGPGPEADPHAAAAAAGSAAASKEAAAAAAAAAAAVSGPSGSGGGDPSLGVWFGPVPSLKPPRAGLRPESDPGRRIHRAVWDGDVRKVQKLVNEKGEGTPMPFLFRSALSPAPLSFNHAFPLPRPPSKYPFMCLHRWDFSLS